MTAQRRLRVVGTPEQTADKLRGLQQREYTPGTTREKLSDGHAGPLLNQRHPGAKPRHRPLAATASQAA
jgi:hypothetical protein